MILHFNCPPTSGSPLATPLVFSWNPDTGEVSGPGAEEVRGISRCGGVSAHPLPWAWEFGPDPLRSYTDMAAIVGSYWRLPDELADHYPQLEDDGIPELTYVDADGVTVIGRDQIVY